MSSRPEPPIRNPLTTARFAGILAVVLIALVGVIAFVPGLLPTQPGPTRSPGTPGPSVQPSSTQIAVSPSPVPSPTFVRPTPTPEPTFLTYVVQPKDTLLGIGRKFDTNGRSIAFWNRDRYPSLDPESEGYDPNRIEIGWSFVLIPGVTIDGSNLPTPTPGLPSPTSTPLPSGSVPSATPFHGVATVISHGDRSKQQIALTFDMGGRLDPALQIVQWLIDHQVHATLFPTGKTGTTTDEGRAALLLAAAHPDLFAFGNHSWDHPNFTNLTAAQMADQVNQTETAVLGLTGLSTRPFWRPPFGAWNTAVTQGVGAAGFRDLIMWDVDTIDWKPTSDGGPTTTDIETKVLANVQGGSIVLMHLGGFNTLDALPAIVSGLQARGLTPVNLAEMLGR